MCALWLYVFIGMVCVLFVCTESSLVRNVARPIMIPLKIWLAYQVPPTTHLVFPEMSSHLLIHDLACWYTC